MFQLGYYRSNDLSAADSLSLQAFTTRYLSFDLSKSESVSCKGFIA